MIYSALPWARFMVGQRSWKCPDAKVVQKEGILFKKCKTRG
jgi:hypothetical protein